MSLVSVDCSDTHCLYYSLSSVQTMPQEASCSRTIKQESVPDKEEIVCTERLFVTLPEVKPESVKKEPRLETVHVKIEAIEEIEESQSVPEVNVKTEIVCVKEEPRWARQEWEVGEDSTQAALYTNHKVEQDLVIGKESVQPQDTAFGTVPPYEINVSYNGDVSRRSASRAGNSVQTYSSSSSDAGCIRRIPKRNRARKRVSRKQCKKKKPELPADLISAIDSDNRFICDVCNKIFTIKTCLIRHIVYYHTRTNQYYCDVCDKRFVSHMYAYTHRKLHTDEKRYSCKVCQKKFACASYLTKHERIHAGEKPHQCEVCLKFFRERSQLSIHALIHEGETAKRYNCTDCPMKFSQRYKLARHQRVHARIQPHVCHICNKKFSQNFQLGVHLRVHTGEKPFPCEVCRKNFVSKNDLVRHERIHTGSKPYSCDICGHKFSQKAHLKAHRLIHTGEKPYSCEVCQKPFAAKGTMNRHRQTHRGVTKYICKVCNKEFKQKGRWEKHEAAHE